MRSSDQYLKAREASIIPPLRDERWARSTGIFDANGAFLHQSLTMRGRFVEGTIGVFREKPEQRRAGRYLYGGQINYHFGHFLCESLARLWALPHLDAPPEAILLTPRRPGSARGFKGFQTAFFNALGINIPIEIVETPVSVEELIVPVQAFGVAGAAVGMPCFRDYIRANFLPHIAPEGPELLYISREGMRMRSGSILGEDEFSRFLTEQGYVEFRPEEHSIETQVARYKAAKKIIAVEGSALHLAGFVGNPSQQVAVIARRSDLTAAMSMVAQLAAFCGIEAVLINAIEREWDVRCDQERSSKSVSLLNFQKLAEALAAAGFTRVADWRVSVRAPERKIARIIRRSGRALTEYPLIRAPSPAPQPAAPAETMLQPELPQTPPPDRARNEIFGPWPLIHG